MNALDLGYSGHHESPHMLKGLTIECHGVDGVPGQASAIEGRRAPEAIIISTLDARGFVGFIFLYPTIKVLVIGAGAAHQGTYLTGCPVSWWRKPRRGGMSRFEGDCFHPNGPERRVNNYALVPWGFSCHSTYFVDVPPDGLGSAKRVGN